MEWFANLLRHYPELAIFLTLAFGFWIGKFKIKKFTLGTVTSVLLVMPSFFGYMLWSVAFLVPVFIIDMFVFFL